jgi:hypothetical protein
MFGWVMRCFLAAESMWRAAKGAWSAFEYQRSTMRAD